MNKISSAQKRQSPHRFNLMVFPNKHWKVPELLFDFLKKTVSYFTSLDSLDKCMKQLLMIKKWNFFRKNSKKKWEENRKHNDHWLLKKQFTNGIQYSNFVSMKVFHRSNFRGKRKTKSTSQKDYKQENFNMNTGNEKPIVIKGKPTFSLSSIASPLVYEAVKKDFFFSPPKFSKSVVTQNHDAHIKTKINYSIKHVFESTTIQEMDILHYVCEIN